MQVGEAGAAGQTGNLGVIPTTRQTVEPLARPHVGDWWLFQPKTAPTLADSDPVRGLVRWISRDGAVIELQHGTVRAPKHTPVARSRLLRRVG